MGYYRDAVIWWTHAMGRYDRKSEFADVKSTRLVAPTTDPKALPSQCHPTTQPKPPKPATTSYTKQATVFLYTRWPFSRLAGLTLPVRLSS